MAAKPRSHHPAGRPSRRARLVGTGAAWTPAVRVASRDHACEKSRSDAAGLLANVRLLGRYLNSTTEAKKVRDLCRRAASEHIERTHRTSLPGPVRLTKAENVQIVALYEAGLTPTQIAAELATSEWTVHHRLNRNGVVRRPIGMTAVEVQEALRLNDAGVPITKLAEQFNRSWKTVAKALRDARATDRAARS